MISVEPSTTLGLGPVLAQALGGLAALLSQDAWRDAARQGLSPTQARALGWLAEHGSARPGALARQLGISAPTLSDALAALEAKGLARRQPDPADSRAVLALLTETGSALAGGLRGWPEYLAARLGELPPVEQAAMLRVMLRLNVALAADGRVPTARACPGCVYLRPGAHPGAARPHHCTRFDLALGAANLRLDCGEFSAAGPAQAQRGLAAWLE